jgi:tRNA-splicing ligase RtcB
MSRTKAKRLVRGDRLLGKLKQRGIYIRAHSMAGLAEEAGFAYKDISEVVDVVHQAGISRKVVGLRPIGNIKG